MASDQPSPARHADVGWVDVPVDVEPGDVAVLALAHQVGHVAHGENVRAAEQREAVVEIEARARLDLREDGLQTRVFDCDRDGDLHDYKCRPTYMSAAQNSKNSTLT
jgi:hypothetical protein